MKLAPIKSDKQYERYLEWVDQQFDQGIKPES